MNLVICLVVLSIAAKLMAELLLARLNRREVMANRHQVPEAYSGVIDSSTYHKSIEYTLAKNKLGNIETFFDAALLAAVLLTGVLPFTYGHWVNAFKFSVWSGAGFLFCAGVALSLLGLPLSWYAQFRLEERFGFNTTTPRLWWLDRVKGLLLAAFLGVPLLALVLKVVQWSGDRWWIYAWVVVLGFQLLMLVLAPSLIMPLFNKFSPLPEGTLRERLLNLGTRTGFSAKNIQVMDG